LEWLVLLCLLAKWGASKKRRRHPCFGAISHKPSIATSVYGSMCHSSRRFSLLVMYLSLLAGRTSSGYVAQCCWRLIGAIFQIHHLIVLLLLAWLGLSHTLIIKFGVNVKHWKERQSNYHGVKTAHAHGPARIDPIAGR
jgi:hypothetical protein